jgi:lysophospholipase L1-like esterase
VDNRSSWYRDYTTIFEDFDEPTYWDSVHPVENGHKVIGEALFQDVKRLGLVSSS